MVILQKQATFELQNVQPSRSLQDSPDLLENPETLAICDQDRKNPDFDICSDIFK